VLRILLFAGVSVLLACSPKYRVEKVYHPPENKACIEKCQRDFKECQNNCQHRYKECLKESIQRAEMIYSNLQKDYSARLKRYYREYELYLKKKELINSEIKRLSKELEFLTRICSKYRDKEACERKKELSRKIRKLKSRRLTLPSKPSEVSLERILEKEREICSCDCGCKEIYDACYQSCGGRVEIKKICVENCD